MSVALTACSRVSAFGRPVGEFHSMRSPTRVTSSSNRIWSRPVLRLRRNGLSRAKNTLVGTLQFSARGRCLLCSDTPYLFVATSQSSQRFCISLIESMATEELLFARTRVHRALGEPGRLAGVDT